MARIAGVDLPSNKKIGIALTYIYGIGRSTAQKIIEESGIDFDKRVNTLTDEEIAKLKRKSDELHKADIEEIRSKTKEELAAVDLRVKQNFEAAAELVLSRLV